jgi:hypothetical protein
VSQTSFVEQVIREQGAYPSEVRLTANTFALPRVLKRSGALLLRSGAPLMVVAGAKKSSWMKHVQPDYRWR